MPRTFSVILHEVKRASEASEASHSEMVEIFPYGRGVIRFGKICSSKAPGGQGMHQIILVHKIKMSQNVFHYNFAFMKKLRYLLMQMCVCLSVCPCVRHREKVP